MPDVNRVLKTKPLNFVLYYQNYVNLYTIYLDDGYEAKPLYLDIFNESEYEIQLAAPGTEAQRKTKSGCHFYLTVPKGILALDGSESLTSDNDWQVKYVAASKGQKRKKGNPNDTLYFSRNTPHTIATASSENQDLSEISLILNNVQGNSAVERRSSDIGLYYGGLTTYKEPIDSALAGISLANRGYDYTLSIVNHLGKKNIPFHASFVGSNTILNDGVTANKLQVQITNIQDRNNPRPDLKIGKNSRFIISFEGDDSSDKSKEWALAESDQINAIEITTRNITGGSYFTDKQQQKLDNTTFTEEQQQAMNAILGENPLTPEEKNQLELNIAKLIDMGERMPWMASGFGEYLRNVNWSVECLIEIKRLNSEKELKFFDGYIEKQQNNTWILKPTLVGTGEEAVPKKSFLRPGEIIEFDLTNIKSNHPSGQTQLTIRYEEIPNYWDGDLVCIIEKSPLMYYSPIKAKANGDTLTAVKIKTDFDDNEKSNVKHIGLAVENGDLALENGDLAVENGDLAVESGGLKTKWATISNLRSQEATFSHKDRATTTDYALSQESNGTTVLNAASGQQIRFRINNSSKLCIDSSGKLGIGTDNPSEKLEVAGDIKTNSALIARAIGDGDAEWMRLSHKALGNQTKYALAQEGGGQTYLNGETIRFRINNQDKMFLNSSGNVGIGTLTPSAKLHVEGMIRSNSLNVTGTANVDTLSVNDNVRVEGNIRGETLQLGSLEIGQAELNILIKLAQNRLKVAIVSDRGYYLDNYNYGVNDGDGDRTIQFQRPPSNPYSSNWCHMTLRIV